MYLASAGNPWTYRPYIFNSHLVGSAWPILNERTSAGNLGKCTTPSNLGFRLTELQSIAVPPIEGALLNHGPKIPRLREDVVLLKWME
jgi:hypothetical protein